MSFGMMELRREMEIEWEFEISNAKEVQLTNGKVYTVDNCNGVPSIFLDDNIRKRWSIKDLDKAGLIEGVISKYE
jgi:hypothetical protein